MKSSKAKRKLLRRLGKVRGPIAPFLYNQKVFSVKALNKAGPQTSTCPLKAAAIEKIIARQNGSCIDEPVALQPRPITKLRRSV